MGAFSLIPASNVGPGRLGAAGVRATGPPLTPAPLPFSSSVLGSTGKRGSLSPPISSLNHGEQSTEGQETAPDLGTSARLVGLSVARNSLSLKFPDSWLLACDSEDPSDPRESEGEGSAVDHALPWDCLALGTSRVGASIRPHPGLGSLLSAWGLEAHLGQRPLPALESRT